MAEPRTVAVISLGGTIDLVGASRLDLAFYTEQRRRLPDGALIDRIPELADIAEIVRVDVPRVPSQAVTASVWLDLAARVRASLASDDVAGVVITHGTNTLEETAFFLDLTIGSDKPVVVVGALRPSSALSGDGELNLVRAVQVARTPEARGQGALVVLNDTIHAAREVTKSSPFRIDAFSAPGSGPLGYADADGAVRFTHRLAVRSHIGDTIDVEGRNDLPRVDVLVSHVGADGVLIDASVAAGAEGLVVAGSGPGATSPNETDALDRAVSEGVVVCLATRTGSGRVPRSPSMQRRGVIAAGGLAPLKARIALSLLLTRTREPEVLQAALDRW